jgi:hypothetical protein
MLTLEAIVMGVIDYLTVVPSRQLRPSSPRSTNNSCQHQCHEHDGVALAYTR